MSEPDPHVGSASQATVSVQHPTAGVVVVVPQGELDIATAPALEDRIEEAERGDPRLLIIDLNGLSFMDSSGLRVLLTALKSAESAGRRFALVCAEEGPIRRLLEISGVGDLVRVAANLDELIDEFTKG